MPFVGDSRTQSGPGILILQHHQHEEAGQELDSRGSVLGCRVLHKRLELGHWVLDTDPLGGAAVGDLIGSLLWQRTKRRPISAMSVVFPAATSKDQPEAPRRGVERTADVIGGSLRMVALRDENRQRDTALDVLDSGYPMRGGKSLWPKLPAADFIGVAVTGTNVNEQVQYFHPTDPRQIAANLGDAEIGSWICDLKGDVIDLERTARQQSAQRVVKLPTSPWVDFHGRNSAALQIGDAGSEDVRGGLTYDKDTGNSIAMWSQRQSGVVEHADGCTKHVLGTDADGHKIRSSHIALGAYFTDRAGTMDGPLDHRGALNVLPPKGPFKTDVVFYYHDALPHQFIGGRRDGRHRWHSYAFKYPVDDPGEPGKPPPGDLIRQPDGGIVIHPPVDGAIGRRDGTQQPQPVEPARPPRNLGDDIRSIPPIPPVDLSTGREVEPIDQPVDLSGFDEAFRRGVGVDLSGIEPITDGSGLAPATPDLGFDDRPLIDLLGTDAETFTDAPDSTGRQRRREGAAAAPLLRQQRAGDSMAPRSAEIWPATIGAILWRPAHYVSGKPDIRANRSYTQSDLDAYDRSAPVAIRQEVVGAQSGYSWNYTASPRAKNRTSPHPGGTVAGSMLFMPPERDAADYMIGSIPTRTTSTSYLALMDGVSLSLSAKLSSGLPIDGLRVALTGSSGSKNASWTYLDASGSTRVGTLTHGGTIKPGGAAADLGALSDPWAAIYGTDGDFAGDVNITGKLTVGGLIDPTGLVLTEQASNPWTPAAGYGALWVKNDAPSSLYYTDDAGTDIVKIGGAAPQFDMGDGAVRARIGQLTGGSWPAFADHAFLGLESLDHSAVGNYSFLVNSTASVFVNAPSGQTGALRIDNADVAKWAAGRFEVVDGSVSAPGYCFSADTDTGFYRTGTNSLGLVAGGSLGAGNYGAVALGVADFSRVAAGAVLDLGASGARWGSVYGTTIDLAEQASNPITTAATRAQIWLSNDTTQRLVFEDDAGTETVLAGPGAVTVTIASGALALPRLPQGARVIAAAESGTADTLDSITGGRAGQIIVLQADSGATITCTDNADVSPGADVMRLTAAHSLSSVYQSLTLQYTGSLWVELAISAPA